MFVKFSEIGGFSKLFTDYIENYQKISNYFAADYRNAEGFPPLFRDISSTKRNHAAALKEIITSQYKKLTPSLKTFHNLNLLDKKNTLFITTGQQLGMFGGPLYTLYKTITAIKLADQLSADFPEYSFVPLFWLEGDDHDIDEVDFVQVFDEAGQTVRLLYPSELAGPDKRLTVGEIRFDDQIYQLFDELDKNLRNTDFKERLMELLRSSYFPGNSFKEAFKALMFELFDEKGLIIFDPIDSRVKELLKPVFKNEIENYRTHMEKLIRVSAKLDEEYHAQVKIRPVNLFMKQDNERFALEPDDNGGFRLRRKKFSASKEELLSAIENTPELFSPNVLLRPVCQDFLFPTAFYVGGPGEVSYFAQVSVLYEEFNLQMPVIYPRASATIFEKGITNTLAKFGFTPQEVFVLGDALIEAGLKQVSELNLSGHFDRTNETIDQAMAQLRAAIASVDKTIADASETTRKKMLGYLGELRAKASEAEKRKHETSVRQLNKVLSTVYPEKSLQEREISFIYYANKYGMDSVKMLFNELKHDEFGHQIITLG